MTQFDRDGNLSYSTYLSGSNTDSVNAIATFGTNVWLAGATRSSDFPIAGAAVSDNRAPAVCVEAASPSSSQSYPCDDGFVANLAFGAPSSTPPLRVVNFGSLIDQPVAPAGVVTIFGGSIGPSAITPPQLDSDGKLATVLGGWQVFFDGVAAPLIFAAPGQITAITPNEVAGKAHTVIGVQQQGTLTPAFAVSVPVNATAPAILTQDSSGIGQAVAINLDGTVNSITSPAKAGSIVSLYVTGAGATADGDGAIATSAKPGTAVQVVAGNPYQAADCTLCRTIPRNHLRSNSNQRAATRWSNWRSCAHLLLSGRTEQPIGRDDRREVARRPRSNPLSILDSVVLGIRAVLALLLLAR